MKKVFKIIGIILLIFTALLLATPFLLQSQIENIVRRYVENNVNANVEFSSINLSFVRSFPKAQVDINDLVITNFKPFEGETLATSKSISLTLPIKEVFKASGDKPLTVNKIYLDETLLTLKTNKFGDVNYDIIVDDGSTITDTTNTTGFTFDVEDYAIKNSAFTYIDEGSNTTFYFTEFNHSGKGIFSENISELDTETSARMSLNIDSTNYLNNHALKLDALIGLDLANNKYTFKENKALINELPLEFQGFVQILENGQEIDLTFENFGSDFKDFLAVIPKEYSKNIENVETTGNFKVKGMIKGLVSDETIPQLDISILSNNASFKYPDLPKRVDNITINTAIKNTTGNPDDTFIDINTLNFRIDQDVFKASATLKNITQNMLVNADIDGTLNLANISKAYPIQLEKELSGILKAKLNTAFDMNAIETNSYERIRNNGYATLTDFVFSSEEFVNPIQINRAEIALNPTIVSLNKFDVASGKSDITATGTITNLLGFLLSDKDLQGRFNVTSNQFLISDFMVADDVATTSSTNKTSTKSESLKIPGFLDCTINVNAKNVVYDNLDLKNVTGSIAIKDQKATLNNMTANVFDGKMAIDGDVSTKETTPSFNINLGADGFDIAKSFTDLELLQALAPIAKIMQGKLNTTIKLKGDLDQEFSPNLSSISGDAFAELLTTNINTEDSKLLSSLSGVLSFVDFDKLDLRDLKTTLVFNNGLVEVKPFYLKYKDIDIAVAGSHGFNKSISYDMVFNVPAKYLGSDVNRLIGKINDPEVNKITIPVTANIIGSFTNPKISTDLSSGVSNLVKQLIEIEKKKLLNQGTNTIKDLINGVSTSGQNPSNPNTTQTDSIKPPSTTPPTTEQTIKNILGGILNKNKQKKDTVN